MSGSRLATMFFDLESALRPTCRKTKAEAKVIGPAFTFSGAVDVAQGDQSAKDFAYACRRLRLGEDPDEIKARIAAYRAADKSNPADYGRRTVEAAQRAILG